MKIQDNQYSNTHLLFYHISLQLQLLDRKVKMNKVKEIMQFFLINKHFQLSRTVFNPLHLEVQLLAFWLRLWVQTCKNKKKIKVITIMIKK